MISVKSASFWQDNQLQMFGNGELMWTCSCSYSCRGKREEDIWKHKTDIRPPLMQGHAAHPGECDAEQARHDLDLLWLFLKHRTGTADGAALHLKITSLPDKMTAIWLLYGEQLPPWVNPNLLALHPVPWQARHTPPIKKTFPSLILLSSSCLACTTQLQNNCYYFRPPPPLPKVGAAMLQ